MILDPLRLGIDLNSKNVSDATQQEEDSEVKESRSCNKGTTSTFRQKLQAADNTACIQIYIQATLKFLQGLFLATNHYKSGKNTSALPTSFLHPCFLFALLLSTPTTTCYVHFLDYFP